MMEVGADITIFRLLKGINIKDGKELFKVMWNGGGI